MGRTLATYRGLLEEEAARWRDYRKALRRGDQDLFDELLKYARKHSSTSGYHVSTFPFETMIMSMLLEIKRDLDKLRAEMERDQGK